MAHNLAEDALLASDAPAARRTPVEAPGARVAVEEVPARQDACVARFLDAYLAQRCLDTSSLGSESIRRENNAGNQPTLLSRS